MRPTREQIDAALLTAGRLDEIAVSSYTLAAGEAGSALSPAKRDELLAKCKAGEYVELYLELDAYEQKPGQRNRKFVRIRDGALSAAARSAAGRPFIRDHAQADTLARGGTILDSAATKRGDGDYVIRQRIKLTAPWAVELALRGLLSFVSVGLRATGPVECSLCSATVLERCHHLPGEQVGDRTCEWIFTAAEIVETSSVNVPAVLGAHVDSIRAAMSASGSFSGAIPVAPQMSDDEMWTRIRRRRRF